MTPPTVRESLRQYGRGVVGGLLFSLPLLFTVEMWQTGVAASGWVARRYSGRGSQSTAARAYK